MRSLDAHGTSPAASDPGPLLRRCDLAVCQGVCCHDGAWLTPDDEQRIRLAIRTMPTAFAHLPKVKIITVHAPSGSGRKTATRPFQYQHKPAHFTDSRCVFGHDDGRCGLQVAAVDAGLDPWAWKPLACWLHPLRLGEQGTALIAPPLPGFDPDALPGHDAEPGYPGFATFTPCGEHHADGEPWRALLAEEQAWFARWQRRHP